ATAQSLASASPHDARPEVEAPAHADGSDGSAALPQPALRVEVSEIPPPDAAALERVWVSLADVLGAQLDAAPEQMQPAGAAHREQRAAATQPERAEPTAAARTPAPGPVVAEPPAAAAPVRSAELVQPDAAPRLESAQRPDALPAQPAAEVANVANVGAVANVGPVASVAAVAEVLAAPSHSDKVLHSLAALRSADAPEADGLHGASSKTAVQHTDKVLQTLASLRSSGDQRDAYSCARTSQRARGLAVFAAEPQNAAADEALASLGLQLDIDLDLLEPPLRAFGEPVDLTPVAQAAKQAVPPLEADSGPRALGSGLVALGSEQLDAVRGGFVTPEGMKISFGIERAVYLNGTLVTTTSLNIADLSKISGGQAQVSGAGAGSLGLLQSGLGNVFTPGSISSTAAGMVIQNTLDNQKIQTITRIDAAVNSTGILRAINLQSSMQGAIVNSLRR
ncbi:MAG TPA: hypothetical protein PLB41_10565, partial [Rubrivivax sp.]|nr:hypothetical protein [Rubrivivax sp.]